jgi:hypothetical protein
VSNHSTGDLSESQDSSTDSDSDDSDDGSETKSKFDDSASTEEAENGQFPAW